MPKIHIDKIARITYNSNHWTSPSGLKDKGDFLGSFVKDHGYGFEEWLNSDQIKKESKQKGYYQGFIQRTFKCVDLKDQNIALYAIKGSKGYATFILIGYILNVRWIPRKSPKWDSYFYPHQLADPCLKDVVDYPYNVLYKKLVILDQPVEIPKELQPRAKYFRLQEDPKLIKWCEKKFSERPPVQLLSRITSTSNRDEYVNSYPEKTKVAIIEIRTHQSDFRNALMDESDGCCMVTNLSIKELLIASHIKPFKKCKPEESYITKNGLLLSANLDALFDHFLISFHAQTGELIMAPSITNNLELQTIFGLTKELRLDKCYLKGRENFLREHNKECKKRQ